MKTSMLVFFFKLRPATLLKRISNTGPVKFAKFLRAPFLTEHLRWLLLQGVSGGKNNK